MPVSELKRAIKAFYGSPEADWLLGQWNKRWKVYERFGKYYEKRTSTVAKLAEIYPKIQLQAQGFDGSYTKIFGYGSILAEFAPVLHYRVLPCEICIEIDKLDRKLLKNWLKLFEAFDVQPMVCFSGHKSWHVHVFVKPKRFELEAFAEHPQAKELTNRVYEFLLDFAASELFDCREAVDTGVQLHSHMIRCVYSPNLKGRKFKVPLNGRSYPVWELPDWVVEIAVEKAKLEKDVRELKKELAEIEERVARRRDVLSKVLKMLEEYKAKEYSNYIAYHCFIHPPDKNPSFVFYKNTRLFIDWHDGKRYSAWELFEILKGLKSVDDKQKHCED